jgi:hypothetical protein
MLTTLNIILETDYEGFLAEMLFNGQRLFFILNIFVTAYLFLLKKHFTSPMFAARTKSIFLKFVFLYGIKISAFYLLLTLILYVGFPMIDGWNVSLTLSTILNFIGIFAFVFAFYLAYLWQLLRSNQQMASLLSVSASNFILLVIYQILSSFTSIDRLLLRGLPFVCFLLMGLVVKEFKKKEFWV